MFQPLDRNKPLDRGQPLDGNQPLDRDKPLNGDQPLDRGNSSDTGRRGDPLRSPCPYGYDELLRYALESNSLSYKAEEHINKCKICRQQLESLISINSSLIRKLYRSRCPTVDILARYSADLASLSEGLSVFYHLQSCPLCFQELQEMKNILEDDLL